MADIYTVIADPTRRELLRVLRDRADGQDARGHDGDGRGSDGEISVGEMVVELMLSQPTVSKHLRVLRDAGLVLVREEGQHRYYRIDSEPLIAVAEWLMPFVAVVDDPIEAQELAPATGRTVPAPLRRAAETLPDVGDVGATLGRTVAGARSRILDTAKKRLGHREQG